MKKDILEKLYLLFEDKLNKISYYGGFYSANKVRTFFKKLEPDVRNLYQSEFIDFINEGPINAYAILNPAHKDCVLVIKKDYAEKILVLGFPNE